LLAADPPPAAQGLHGLQGFFAAHGLHGLQGFLAAQGLHGFFPAHGLHGFLAAQGLHAASWMRPGLGFAAGNGADKGCARVAACALGTSTMALPTTKPSPAISGMTVVVSSLPLVDLIFARLPQIDC
jgi:hypothetical protein